MSLDTAISALKSRLNGQEFIKARVKFDLGPDGSILADGTQSPAVISERDGPADVTLILSKDNFMALLDGGLNPQMAVMTGKLKIDGNMGLAMQLGQLLS